MPVTITIELAPELQAELARQAATRGVGIDSYAASLIEDAAYRATVADEAPSSTPSREVFEAIEMLKSFGRTHRLSLGDMTIRELRHEARPGIASSSTLR
jgi:hypothetical protein